MNAVRKSIINSLIGGSVFIAIVAFIAYQIEFAKSNAIERNNFEAHTVGELVEYGRSGHSGRGLTYKYYVDGIEYTKSTWAKRWFRKCEKTGWCLGLKFRVKYSSVDPQNSIILLDEPVEEPDKTDGSNL